MIEQVAHHQTRFRLPGLAPDARGVALGERALLLFSSLDRLLGFLRAYSEVESLDEIIPSLELQQVVTPLRTTEFTVSMLAESSYRMDRVSELTRVARGHCYTGTGRFFVRYRDRNGPFGYDVASTVETTAESDADVVIHDLAFSQGYQIQRPLSLRALLFRLRPRPLPDAKQQRPDAYWLTTEPGLFRPVLRYLVQAGVSARAGTFDAGRDSSFQERAQVRTLIEMIPPPGRVVRLLRDLPGVRLFYRVSERIAVEVGFRHPVALESCGGAFDEGSLTLFRGDGDVESLSSIPALVPLHSLVTCASNDPVPPSAWDPSGAEGMGDRFQLELQVVPTTLEARRAEATVVPTAEWPILGRALHALPPATIQSLQLAVTNDSVFVCSGLGLEGIPLGEYFHLVARGLYVPRGNKVTPELSQEALAEVIPQLSHSRVFLRGEGQEPWVIASSAFGPVSRWALMASPAELLGRPLAHQDRPLPASFGYGDRPLIGSRVKGPKSSETKKT